MKGESELFKAMADETRLRILHLLVIAKEPLCVCEMVDALKLPQYQVSKHLLILKNADLLEVEKQGTWGYHSLKTEGQKNRMLISFLKNYLTSEVFLSDKRNLELRLLLREEGKCVVGVVPERELLKLIKEKSE